MKVLELKVGTKNLQINERPEPGIDSGDGVKLRVLRVGICGTDREEASGGRAKSPEGSDSLVIGHEMLGQVVGTGDDVERVRPGDYAVFTVRRGCNSCLPCKMERPDMCSTGNYRERGIWGLDGYHAEFVVDKESYIVKVPSALGLQGVLCEPLSVVEKALDEALKVQRSRLPDAPSTPDWLFGKNCMVVGLGPIGLLAAMVLRLRGAYVYGLDIVEKDSNRPKWLQIIGGTYIDGREVRPKQVDEKVGEMDMIVEAAGVASLDFNLLDALAPDGIMVLTGIPGDKRPFKFQGGEIATAMVLNNLALVGSVNASRDHFQLAVDDLEQATQRWGLSTLSSLITHSYTVEQAVERLGEHPSDTIKEVVEWNTPANSANPDEQDE